MPVIPALGRLRQKDLKFKASLGYKNETVSKYPREGKREEGKNLKAKSHTEFSFDIYKINTVISKVHSTSIIFFRICRNRRVKASDFFFRRFRPVCAPFKRAFMMVCALYKQRHILVTV
jgi:hypothetical protein